MMIIGADTIINNSAQIMVNSLELMSDVSQFMPSSKFSPVTALQGTILQWWVFMESSSSACVCVLCACSYVHVLYHHLLEFSGTSGH